VTTSARAGAAVPRAAQTIKQVEILRIAPPWLTGSRHSRDPLIWWGGGTVVAVELKRNKKVWMTSRGETLICKTVTTALQRFICDRHIQAADHRVCDMLK
jgi:hypothetical protein